MPSRSVLVVEDVLCQFIPVQERRQILQRRRHEGSVRELSRGALRLKDLIRRDEDFADQRALRLQHRIHGFFHFGVGTCLIVGIAEGRRQLSEIGEGEVVALRADSHFGVAGKQVVLGLADGVISGVTSSYIFVELENTVEGAVSIAYMNDDLYFFNEAEYAMIGKNKGKKYQLGDKVRIKVLNCDKIKKNIDFSIIDDNIE